METATLTSTTHASLDRLRSTIIGRRRKRAHVHYKLDAPVSGHFIQTGSSQGLIGLGSLCRRRGSPAKGVSVLPTGFTGKSNGRKPYAFLLGTGNQCNARVNPLMPSERLRHISSTARFSLPPVLLACSGAPFSAEGGGDFNTSKRLFYTRITAPYKWHRWLQSPSRIMLAACRGRNSDFTSDEFGPYPWDPLWNASENEAIEWIQEDIVTLFTTDGLIQIGGSLVPHQSSPMERKQARGKTPVRYRRFREEDYMDPKQGLCLGASFDIVATNGLDMGRRFCVFGFCRSIEMLSDVVEDTVLEQGGEVVVAAKGNWRGLNEKLSMRVAVPLLWGVPPAVDTLNYAIRCGGGIVEKVSRQWEFL